MDVAQVKAVGNLTIEIIAAPNLVVDSNALATSTYAPKVATVIAKVCNLGADPVNDVVAYIGDYTGAGAVLGTPGHYPERSDPISDDATLTYRGTYEFLHLGGSADAARSMGTLASGDCGYQYWSFEYPHYAIDDSNGNTIATWGVSVKPDDDLWLEFDVWATGDDSITPALSVDATHKATMRNEISAMANKIKPNGNPAGQWFNTNTSTVYPGQTIETNGVLYRLGNINQGFDNDNDGAPDYNAWLQPFGDPAYDPSCFRLIGVTGSLTVTRSAGNADMIIPIQDNLYFTNLPADNTDVRGVVYYEFLALGGACTIPISPYQEVASGSDNEKFNGDYGTGVPALLSYDPEVDITKSAPGTQAENTTFTYSIPFVNNSPDTPAGLTLSSHGVNAGLMISDTVPTGLQYVAGSAGDTVPESTNTVPTGNSLSIRYSVDGGATWSSTDPGTTLSTAANPVVIQWWLDEPLDDSASGNNAGMVRYRATIPATYLSSGGAPFIENCAESSFGDGAPFDRACDTTLVEGTGEIGNRVWKDDDGDGTQDTGETDIDNVTVSLYWDKNDNDQLDAGDVLVATQDSGSTTDADETDTNYNFTNLPNGEYLVVVDKADSDIDTVAEGYTLTTPEVFAVTLDATDNNYDEADFGFGPTLVVKKALTSRDLAQVADEDVTFVIDLINTLPGDGTANGFCQYALWASAEPPTDGTPASGTGTKAWYDPSNTLGLPNNTYAYTDLSDASDDLGLSGFNISDQGGTITKVEYVVYTREKDLLAAGEDLTVKVYRNNGTADVQIGSDYVYDGATSFTGAVGDTYTFREDVTSIHPNYVGPGNIGWSWADFVNDTAEMQLTGNKSAAGQGNIEIDAAAYLITTDQLCGGADTTIATLPMTDTFDADLLDFLYADPPASAATTSGTAPNTTGTITWTNLGPLYAGGTQRITVTFKALAPTALTTNVANVYEAKFGTGRNVNDDNDDATVTVEASGSIAGTTWADSGATAGWLTPTPSNGYDGSDSFIPGVVMELYGCFDLYSNELLLPTTVKSTGKPCTDNGNEGEWRLIETQVTDANGDYLFDALHNGYYDVRVDTSSLPENFTTATAEPALAGNGAGFTCGTCDGQWNADDNLQDINNIDNSSGGEDITRVNFGFRNAANLGSVMGYVWHDVDQDGVWDTDEPPIPNTTVSLTCSGTACPASTPDVTTDENGLYTFSDLPTGTDANYQVVITSPSGMNQTGDPDEPGTTCATSCDDQTSTSFTLTPNEIGGPYNFGYTGGLNLGDTLFVDWDGDGTQDTGDEGIGGVQVRLYRDTDGDGVYTLGTDTLLKAVTTMDYDVVNGYIDVDGDGTPNEATEDIADLHGVVVIDGALDIDGDGDIDADDDGWFADYRVVDGRLDMDNDLDGDNDDDGTLLGKYQFADLPGNGNNYFVHVTQSTLPSGYVQTADPDATQDSKTTMTLNSSDDWSADFGYQPRGTGAIGDTVWFDDNADGVIDASESGISGVTVNLYEDQDGDGVIDAEDALVGTETTMNYNIVDGYIDVDGDGTSNETNEDLADLHGVAVVDGALDINGNGVIDTNDDGIFVGYSVINGVIDINGSGTVTTDDTGSLDGRYQFPNLASGDYIVEIPDSNFNSGQPLYSQVQTYDPNSVTVRDNQDVIALGDDETYVLGDFGYTSSAIGDFVWRDDNGDGVLDDTETGINGVMMELYLDANNDGVPDDAAIATTTTANNDTGQPGYYLFGGLSADNYIVRVADSNFLPSGALYDATTSQPYTQTYDPNAYNDTSPSLSCLTAGATGCDNTNVLAGITAPDSTFFPGLQLGQNDMSSDFGYQPPATIGDFIWKDYDGDGVQDEGEPGIEGVDVFLCGTSSPCTTSSGDYIETATTNENGYYYFRGQTAGTYVVTVDTTTLPTGFTTQTGDPEGNNDDSANADTTGNVSDMSNDFGYTGDRLISGTIFFDKSTLGSLYESGTDTPFSGVVVYLYDDTTGERVGAATTDSNGFYQFNVAPGNYTIRVAESLSTQLNGMTGVYEPDEASDDGYCGTGSLTCDNGTTVDVTSDNATNQDFGYFADMDMGDLPSGYDYTILMNQEGPIHINDSGAADPTIFLGAEWDAETDGNPDGGAGHYMSSGGDDNTGGGNDDEDGIDFLGELWIPERTVDMQVTITDNDTAIGGYTPYLVGWFDWNQDGDFYDAEEKIEFGNLDAGVHTLSLTIPDHTGIGLLNMRFRLYATQSPPAVVAPTGTVTNGEVEDYQVNNTPTSVNLAAFDADAQEDGVHVTWETAAEMDNLGFNLYRSENQDGPYTQLNATLIPVQNPGATFGAAYTWLDTDVQPGITYYYTLEDVDVNGVATLHGPVSTTGDAQPTAVDVQTFTAQGTLWLTLGLVALAGGLTFFRRQAVPVAQRRR